MEKQKNHFINYTKIAIIICSVWGVLVVSDVIFGLFSPEENTLVYDQAPDYLKLKSGAKDVLYSETLSLEDGDIVKYAYVADEVPAGEGEDINRRTAVSQTQVLDVSEKDGRKTEKLKTVFFAKPQFYNDGGVWKQVEYATTTPEVFSASGAMKYAKKRDLLDRLLPGREAFAATLTAYPNADVETTSVDGSVQNVGTGGLMSTACNIARGTFSSGGAVDNGTSIALNAQGVNGGYVQICYMMRATLLFDTSSLPDNSVISATTLSVYVTATAGVTDIQVFSSNPASNTALTTSDWGSVGSTAYATAVTNTSMTTSAYNALTFNSTGRAAVSVTGITKTSLRNDYDYSAFNPGAGTFHGITFSTADTSGTSQDPKLDITYTSDSFSFGQWFPF